jgi:hypothetical protein
MANRIVAIVSIADLTGMPVSHQGISAAIRVVLSIGPVSRNGRRPGKGLQG